MKKPTLAQQREWAAKLRASGFEDLESPGGLLSNRGMRQQREDRPAALADLAESATYYDDAREALRSYRFASRRDRDIWNLHVERMNDADIARHLGISYRQVYQSKLRIIGAIREAAREPVSQVRQVRHRFREKIDRMAKGMGCEMLLALATELP